MPTYGRHSGRGSATAYPVMCAVCGVVWPRSAMRRDGSGRLICPDEGKGLDAKSLDRLNAKIRPPRRQGPSDGLVSISDPTPASILGTRLYAWIRPELGEFTELQGFVVSMQNLAGTGDLIFASANRGVRFDPRGASGRPAFVGSGGNWSISSSTSTALPAAGRPYYWCVGALTAAPSAAFHRLLSTATGGTTTALIHAQQSSNKFRVTLSTTSGSDVIEGPDCDTGLHLFECGFLSTTAGRFVVDGISYSGALTAVPSADTTRVFFGSDSGAWPGTFAEAVISYSPPTTGEKAQMRSYFSERYPELEIA